jgi:hypothetical protein
MDLFDLETVADAGGTGGAPAGDAPSQTAPAAPDGGAQGGEPVSPPAGATEAAPAWSPEDPAFAQAIDDRALALIDQRFGPIAQLLEQTLGGGDDPGGQQQFGGVPQLQLDPFDEGFGANLAQLLQAQNQQMLGQVQQLIGQVAQPLNAQLEQQTIEEGNQRLKDMIADDVARNGDFPRAEGAAESKAQQLIQPLAEAMFPGIAARYGAGPRAAEVAIQQASSTIRAIIAEAGAAAVAAHQNQLGTLAGARGEPGSAAAGTQGVPDTLDPSEVTRRYAASGRALSVAGG